MIRALVIDLDGVIRHWDPLTAAEQQLGLPEGAILRAAFEPDRLGRAITGRTSDEEWRREVARELTEVHAIDGDAAVAAWSEPCGVVDDAVLEIVRRARSTLTVALLSNATTRLAADLARLGIDDAFDLVLNSAELGVAKPGAAVFHLAADRLGVPSEACLFVDDSPTNVERAAAVGMVAHHHRSVGELERFVLFHAPPAGGRAV